MSPNFRQNLKDWTIHGLINATPSFVIALQAGWTRTESILGMLVGVFSFIVMLAFISSHRFCATELRSGFLGCAVLWGRNIRSLIAGLSILGLIMEKPQLYSMDISAGILAGLIFSGVFGEDLAEPGERGTVGLFWGDMASLFPTLFMTVIEGVVLCTLMILIAIPFVYVSGRFRIKHAEEPGLGGVQD